MSAYLQIALLASVLTLTIVAVLIWCRRRVGWVPYVGLLVVSVAWGVERIDVEGMMAKKSPTIATLRKDAEQAIAAKDWPAAQTAIDALKSKKPDGRKHACALRGQMFDVQGKLEEAQVEYQTAYDLGDHVAGGSAADVAKRIKARATP